MKDEDILFHFKPYFSDGGKGRVIVRNSQIGGAWGSEERETPSFSFEHGKSYLVSWYFIYNMLHPLITKGGKCISIHYSVGRIEYKYYRV
uniref:Galectin n=1 Tax=Astyanax mexicanus TaxID=7994 RepID=A0A3B1J653_ASTMX